MELKKKVDNVSKLRITLVAAALVASLSSCSMMTSSEVRAFDGITPACETFKGGAEIDSVKVTDEKGKVPTVDFLTATVGSTIKSQLSKIKSTQTKVIREGSGPKFTGDQLVIIEYAVFSANSGTLQGSSKFDGTDAASQVFNSKNSKVYCDALSGVKQGSLVAFAVPASESDPEGSLFVIDLKKVYLPHAVGYAKAPEAGLPSVVLTPKTGQPGIIAPNFAAPKEFKRSILIEGRGEEVKVGDSVTVHYVGWIWATPVGSPFDSSWTSGTPATFTLAETNLIPGFVKALTGVKVGSQVVAAFPSKDGYGDAGNSSIPGKASLIFVIDVLGINK